jgi:aspartate/tyrosine/aromatic aminotransferase
MLKYHEILSSAPADSVLVLQGGQPHNQTGKNLSLEQLHEIIPILNKNNVQVLIDAAYLGLGLEISRDLEFVRTAFREINNVALAVSFSKNACLYRHRCGALFFKTGSAKSRNSLSGNYLNQEKIVLESHFQKAIGQSISNAPAFGAMVMKNILKNNSREWLQELDEMRLAVDERREFLVNSLNGKLDYLRDCRGMFGVLQISPAQIIKLREKYSVYILDSGRINFAGISDTNRDYLVESLRQVLN